MAKRDEGLALVAVLIAFIAIGTEPPPEPPDPWDIHAHPFGTLPNDSILGPDGQCNDFGVVGPTVDDDGNGFANEEDPRCIMLWDIDSNGICDSRYWRQGWDEGIFAEYTEFSCTGWE